MLFACSCGFKETNEKYVVGKKTLSSTFLNNVTHSFARTEQKLEQKHKTSVLFQMKQHNFIPKVFFAAFDVMNYTTAIKTTINCRYKTDFC